MTHGQTKIKLSYFSQVIWYVSQILEDGLKNVLFKGTALVQACGVISDRNTSSTFPTLRTALSDLRYDCHATCV